MHNWFWFRLDCRFYGRWWRLAWKWCLREEIDCRLCWFRACKWC